MPTEGARHSNAKQKVGYHAAAAVNELQGFLIGGYHAAAAVNELQGFLTSLIIRRWYLTQMHQPHGQLSSYYQYELHIEYVRQFYYSYHITQYVCDE